MDGQVDFAETALTQDLFQLIFTKTAARVEVLSFGGVEDGLVLNVREVVIKVFGAVGVEEAQVVMRKVLFDIIEGEFFMCEFYLDWFGRGCGIVVDEDLGIGKGVQIFRRVIFCLRFSLQGRTLFSLFNY